MSKGVSAGFPSNNVGIKTKIWRQQHTCKPSPRQVWQSLRTTLNSNGTYFTKCLNNNYTINSNGNLSNPSVFRAVTWCHTILYYTILMSLKPGRPFRFVSLEPGVKAVESRELGWICCTVKLAKPCSSRVAGCSFAPCSSFGSQSLQLESFQSLFKIFVFLASKCMFFVFFSF